MLYNQSSVILGLVHFLLPFMILNIYVSLEGLDQTPKMPSPLARPVVRRSGK
ncbi:MAG: hypothetical protein R3E89_04975 [Thiolinea sp.]